MELQSIDMARGEARRAFLEYRASVRELRDREIDAYDDRKAQAIAEQRATDEAIMAGYRQIALGRQVIVLRDVIAQGGVDDQGRPRLAIARADQARLRMTRGNDGHVDFGTGQRSDHRDPRTRTSWSFPAGTLPVDALGWRSATAIVPHIPPRFRPATLNRYALLFEAEWRNVVPVDPALLRALGGGLYIVVATWDLTPLERAVLAL